MIATYTLLGLWLSLKLIHANQIYTNRSQSEEKYVFGVHNLAILKIDFVVTKHITGETYIPNDPYIKYYPSRLQIGNTRDWNFYE